MKHGLNTDLNIARLLTILRGLLAEPSRRPDDPWQRVIFKPCTPSSGASDSAIADVAIADAAIDLENVASKAADDELRGQLRAILPQSTARPDRVIVPGGSAYCIERGAVSAQA